MMTEQEQKNIQDFIWSHAVSRMNTCRGSFPYLQFVVDRLPFRVSTVEIEGNGWVLFCSNPTVKIRQKVPFEVSIWAIHVRPASDGEYSFVDFVVPITKDGPRGVYQVRELLTAEEFHRMMK